MHYYVVLLLNRLLSYFYNRLEPQYYKSVSKIYFKTNMHGDTPSELYRGQDW